MDTDNKTDSTPKPKPPVAVLGGTGPEGRGLALRWAAAGYPVVVGSRQADRAKAVAEDLAGALTGVSGAVPPMGAGNLDAARAGAWVVLSVPYAAQAATLDAVRPALEGKVLISVVVPLRPPRVGTVQLPPAGSAAAEAQLQLGAGVPVAAAFQNVSATKLLDLGSDIGCDVLVCADDAAAKAAALGLVAACGAEGFDAGPLANAGVVEGMTSILIGINKQLRVAGAGVRITNVPRGSAPTA